MAKADALGSFSDPFDRVDFWVQDVNGASWMLGSDTSGESGRVGGSESRSHAIGHGHTLWTRLRPTLYMLYQGGRFPAGLADSDMHTVRAFGVNDDGVALTCCR